MFLFQHLKHLREEFVLQGYQVSAIGYVLKPIDEKNMYFFIEKAHNRVLKEKIKDEKKIFWN